MLFPGFGGLDNIIIGDDNDNFLQGTNRGETIIGEGGNDVIAGGGTGLADDGDDIMDGGSGNDIITGGVIFAGPTGDLFVGSDTTGQDIYDGGLGADLFVLGGISQDGQIFIHYDTPGIADYAFIEDFNPGEDQLFLAPAPNGTQYTFGAVPADAQLFDNEIALFLDEEVIAVIDSNGTALDFARDVRFDVA